MRASPERLYRGSVRTFAVVFVLVGVAVLASTFANGGGVLSIGFWIGLAFVAVGILRGRFLP